MGVNHIIESVGGSRVAGVTRKVTWAEISRVDMWAVFRKPMGAWMMSVSRVRWGDMPTEMAG